MKVTQVEPQKKTPHRFNIYLDGQFGFGADEDLVVNRRLIPGKQLDNPELEVILFEAEVGKLMERMYKLFGLRMRSEKEVRDYLRKLSFKRKAKDQEEIAEVTIKSLIERLKQKGMVNDEVFARAWVESRSKKKGKNLVKAELFQKGIDREIIEEVISSQQSVVSEEEIAAQALEKKARAWSGLPNLEFRQKATQFLVRRGFDYSVAKEVIDNFLQK